ncbi:Alpha,alpha-trehalose-phosphate synthase [Actinidia chinensis var. chinensis]|uniref:Alpha,alpha-trehalose-phosphate synthase n=1 Tax=Actinidia chinensis var. chinensis TaxID=1590841 RepID=A0A2R6PUB6_ACTCC|nr:Alpha,alpha-trehalose-phosphate synthase [Actinidia chinensis var. chinensis]
MKSCSSFSNLASGNLWDLTETSITVPQVCPGKKIIVSNFLPLHAHMDLETEIWTFVFDEDSLLLQLKEGFSSGNDDVVYVGSVNVNVDERDQDKAAEKLLEELNCVPTFLSPDLQEKFYHRFCLQYLCPLFHYTLTEKSDPFDRMLWKSYISANRVFADKVGEVINAFEDYVWIHDYHLMILPTFLRVRNNRVKIGFFLHVPFPSSEIFRALPVKDEILRGLLNADLVGFQTYDYARHFLSCCNRILGLNFEYKRGHIGVEYFGRTVYIKILPAGVDVGRLESALDLPDSYLKAKEIQQRFEGKKLLLGIDDVDVQKGISLKLLAVEKLLKKHPVWREDVVLVQVVSSSTISGTDIYRTTKRINEAYGSVDYEPVVLIYGPMPLHEKIAYYALADCYVLNATRDGLNLNPYEYVVCRQGGRKMDEALGILADSPRTSILVVSEFVGCSPSFSRAIRVNPWDICAMAESLNVALYMHESERQLRHEKHYRYVKSHDVANWARSFMQDLERACEDHHNMQCWGLGFGLSYRVLSLPPNFKKLSTGHIVSAYKKTKRRAVFLDYDGTLVPQSSFDESRGREVNSVLNNLCSDPKNTVFIVSGRGKNSLGELFVECENVGIAAEHGYFIRWNGISNWETSPLPMDFSWKRIAEPIMRLYTESTDGSFIEAKESALVWNHHNADPSFGPCQAKELLDHLENVLANHPVTVKRGHQIVEVKPQGLSKGLVAEKVLSTMIATGKPPDFVMCIGDDRSDEDMFESILGTAWRSSISETPEIFACTIGQKPSKATYYVDDTSEVLRLLQSLTAVSSLTPLV